MAERGSSGESDRRRAKDDDSKPAERDGRNGKSIPPPAPSSAAGEGRSRERTSVPPPPKSSSANVAEPEPEVTREPHPSIPPLPASGPWRSYKEIVAGLATRIVEGQRPIRVLQAVRWDNAIDE